MKTKNDQLELLFIWGEKIIYFLIAILLFSTAIFLIYNSSFMLIEAFHANDYTRGALHVIDRVLLTLMVVEILYTVKISMHSHTLEAEPFFIVGLIASIRRILIISVESAYIPENFYRHMIEMGVLGGIIIIFVFSFMWCKKRGNSV